MNVDSLDDILAQHADALIKSDTATADVLAASLRNEGDAGLALFDIAERAKRVLRPVSPALAFRARLRDSLMLAAHQQQAHRVLSEKHSEATWGWLIGAAAIGSAAGIIAFILRLRAQGHRVVATSEAKPS